MQTLGLSKYFQLEAEVPALDSRGIQKVLDAVGAIRGIDVRGVIVGLCRAFTREESGGRGSREKK